MTPESRVLRVEAFSRGRPIVYLCPAGNSAQQQQPKPLNATEVARLLRSLRDRLGVLYAEEGDDSAAPTYYSFSRRKE